MFKISSGGGDTFFERLFGGGLSECRLLFLRFSFFGDRDLRLLWGDGDLRFDLPEGDFFLGLSSSKYPPTGDLDRDRPLGGGETDGLLRTYPSLNPRISPANPGPIGGPSRYGSLPHGGNGGSTKPLPPMNGGPSSNGALNGGLNPGPSMNPGPSGNGGTLPKAGGPIGPSM